MTIDFSRAGLEGEGFVGFLTVTRLRASQCLEMPVGPGVYVVLCDSPAAVEFLTVSLGGHFKGRDPTVPVAELQARWPTGTPVLYIGKGDALRRRVVQLLDFGVGSPVGHWGGRYLWQVEGSDHFLVGWQQHSEPRRCEHELLTSFESTYGQLPFANLVR
jgi:hypothetical protein